MAEPGESETEQQPNAIPVDPEWQNSSDETDSAFGDQLSAFTASLASGVLDYQYENGRRYHAYDAGSYPMPNDDSEADRMDCFHAMMMVLHEKKLHLAPIGPSPQRILDLGTGTGIWAIDMGDEYPSAQIIGNDLSPIQPDLVPPNVRFIVDNIEKPWVGEEPFDYIHCRYLSAAIQDWPALVHQVYENLKPGGWAEFSDYDIMFYAYDDTLQGTHLYQWIVDIIGACKTMGVEPSPGARLKQMAIDAGFQEVVEHVYELPTGPWPIDKKMKVLGIWSALHLLKGLEGFTLALFTRILGWSVDQIQVMLSLVRKDVKSPKVHSFQRYHVVYGRKPGNGPA